MDAIRSSNKREKRTLETKNIELKKEVAATKEKMAELKEISSDLFDKCQRLESEMKKLGVVEKKKIKITDQDLVEYNRRIRGQFDLLRSIVQKVETFKHGGKFERLKICLKPRDLKRNPKEQCSFSLQWFLDYLYDKKDKSRLAQEGVFNITDFRKCREVIFVDIMTQDDIKKANKKPATMITESLIAEWNVIFTKNEECSNSKTGKGLSYDV